MKPHIDKDEDTTEEEHVKAQKIANAHAAFWSRILNISKSTGRNEEQGEKNHIRAKNNLIAENCELPPIYGLRKDHKKVEDETKGPPLRPVCSATSAYNSKLAHLMNKVLIQIWKGEEENCASTEELLAEFDKLNKEGIPEKAFIGSADVVALYPSLDIKEVTRVVGEMIEESNVEIEGVDYNEIGMYLAVNNEREELEREGIDEMCHKRIAQRGRKPTLTGQAKHSEEERRGKWHEPKRKPTSNKEKKKLLAEAIKIALKFILENHFYTFNREKKRQKEGGPIGLVVTDAIAKIYMTWWDRKVKAEAKKEGMEILLYRRYVDDINIIARVSRGEREEYGEKEGMELFKQIGNGIHKSIQLEIDYPEKHEDKKMPLLDVKVWMMERNDRNKKVIMYEHYRKEMASRMKIHQRSAIPYRDKMNILTQEVIRTLKNCSRELPWEEKAKQLEETSLMMQFSGYNATFRKAVIQSGLKAYRKMEERDRRGITPLHRPREWKKTEREKIKRKKKENWYKTGGYESPIFIPATPNSELKRRLQNIVNSTNQKIKVVERAGNSILSTLRRVTVNKGNKCENEECLICETTGKGKCRKEGVLYEIECSECGEKYIGETGRNGFTRGKEHADDLRKKSEKSVLYRHYRDKHHGEEQPTYEMRIRKVFGEDATMRQITEAITIKNENPQINSKEEWGHLDLPRIRIE